MGSTHENARASCRASVFNGPGSPFILQALPRPNLSTGEALVRITMATICGSDVHTYLGRRETPTPTVLGHEAVGVVEELGPGDPPLSVDGRPVRVGDRITWGVATSCDRCHHCRNGLPQKCVRSIKYGHAAITGRHGLNGCLASHIHLLAGSWLVHVPEALIDEVASPAGCATATAAAALRSAGPVEGRTVFVTGLGLLGLTACAMARAAGAREVVAVDVREDRRQRAGDFGATIAVAETEAMEGVWAGTEGRGADVALEMCGAPEAVSLAVRALGLGGVCILVGSVFPQPALDISPELIVRRCLTIKGQHNYRPADLLAGMGFLHATHSRYPFAELVDACCRLDEIGRAFVQASSGIFHRVAVRPN